MGTKVLQWGPVAKPQWMVWGETAPPQKLSVKLLLRFMQILLFLYDAVSWRNI